MNWNDLKTFLAIYENGTLAGAARDLGQNHSTVFRRLNALEKDLDTRLFDRLAEGYVATPSGDRLAEHARQADNAIQRIQLEVAGRDLAPTGTVTVTAASNIARTLGAEVVGKLRKSHPGIRVELLSADTDYDLNRREADIAIRATNAPPPHLVGRKLMELGWWFCRASGSRKKTPASLDDLAKLPLIGADNSMLRLKAFQWLEERYADSVVARSNDLSTMASLAREGVGYALLPSDQQETGLCRVLQAPRLTGELWLLTHPDLRAVTRNRVVWDSIVEHSQNVSL